MTAVSAEANHKTTATRTLEAAGVEFAGARASRRTSSTSFLAS